MHLTEPHYPDGRTPGMSDLLCDYLDYYRSTIIRKVEGLSDDDFRRRVAPSGWSPADLLVHLAAMERRWIRWGFAGDPVTDPWRDHAGGDPEGTWESPSDITVAQIVARLTEDGRRTRDLVSISALDERAAVGGRFTEGEQPTLGWILMHVLQEYARHAGHLDVIRELIDGRTGE